MARYYFYDRRTVATTEQQFFHESRGKAAAKELGTNMEKDLQFPYDVTIRRILLIPRTLVHGPAAQRDTGFLDEIATFIQTGIIQIQVGEGRIDYYPAVLALASAKATGAAHYTQATAADGTLLIGSLNSPLDGAGLEVEIAVPANTDFKFFVKQSAATDIGSVQAVLVVDRP